MKISVLAFSFLLHLICIYFILLPYPKLDSDLCTVTQMGNTAHGKFHNSLFLQWLLG